MTTSLERALARLPVDHPGPGGAAAVIRNGEILLRHAWGWANTERRIRFTPQTLFRICSITKQFTCGLVLDHGAPERLDAAIAARLPRLEELAPDARALCHNQSGLRDYWAIGMLHGALPETPFGDREAAHVIAGTRSLQFSPGSRASYVNQNFRLLSDALESETGRSFAELLRTRLFEPAGMGSALLAADTRAMPDGTQGYEGSEATGFQPADTRILWTGDAGIGASLDDLIAWERFLWRGADTAGSLPARLYQEARFSDGSPARYGFGLRRQMEAGRLAIGHGGALRGWRSMRLHVPSEGLSVIVLFNHMADAQAAASSLLAAALDHADEAPPPPDDDAPPAWLGTYIEPETGLAARLDRPGPGQVRLRYAQAPERLALQTDGSAGTTSTRLHPTAAGLEMIRPADNQRSILQRVPPAAGGHDIAGRYRCEELDAGLTVADAGGTLYGAFSGFLGEGRMERLVPLGADLWALPCPRALDHAPPGDWTLHLRRDGSGRPEAIGLGCWLARRLTYGRVGGA